MTSNEIPDKIKKILPTANALSASLTGVIGRIFEIKKQQLNENTRDFDDPLSLNAADNTPEYSKLDCAIINEIVVGAGIVYEPPNNGNARQN